MMVTNEEYALKQALEIAKIVCANPSVKVYPDSGSAQNIIDFVKTLADGISGKASQ